ncbi:hypothetical protein ACEPAI_2922 [Sanghuangporus weigelae]
MPIPTTSTRMARAEPPTYVDRAKRSCVPTLREGLEEIASRFLSENRERIIGRQLEFVSREAFLRRQLLKKQINILEAEYNKRVRLILWNKDQIEQLREAMRTLSRFGTWRHNRVWVDRSMAAAMKEFERREADEQGMLEDVRDVAMDIIYLGRHSYA